MKSHFRFSKKERNGIFLLVAIVVLISFINWFLNNRPAVPVFEDDELRQLRQEVDSLNASAANKKIELYPFNPNFISDFKGYTLGMTTDEIDALHQFREQNKWINSAEDFQRITGVSDAWLDSIGPYFKFPEWVSNSKSNTRNVQNMKVDKELSFAQKTDLNKTNAKELQKIYGVGPKLSERIIKYREQYEEGFAHEIELFEIYGLEEEVIERILLQFAVKTPRTINRVPINSATSEDLVRIPYIDYELAYSIIEYRTLHEGIAAIEELTKIEDFPENKINLIGLYLQF